MRAETSVWIWRVLRFLALVCFLLAVLVALGGASIDHHEALLPLGLLLWCASAGIP